MRVKRRARHVYRGLNVGLDYVGGRSRPQHSQPLIVSEGIVGSCVDWRRALYAHMLTKPGPIAHRRRRRRRRPMKLSYMLGAAIALLGAVVPLQAQPYPNRPIR